MHIFENKITLGIVSFFLGILGTILTQIISNRRAVFRYFVTHERIAISTEDKIFGSVKVTWNGNSVENLYLSTIEMINESVRDYENVEVQVYTNDSMLLSESTQILGTPTILEWTEEFTEELRIPEGQKATQLQLGLVGRERRFLIPVLNRYQKVRMSFLNKANINAQPNLWVHVSHKGVKTQYGIQGNRIFGVSHMAAAVVGAITAIPFSIWVLSITHTAWLVLALGFMYGFFVVVPGAFLIKGWNLFFDWLVK